MDLRAIAKRRLPGGVFDYIDGAAEDERSLARSMTAFADIEFVPRVLRDVSEIDTTTTLLGEPMAFPFIAAPTGFTRIAHSEGELAVARAAGAPDSLHLSTLSTRSIEECCGQPGPQLVPGLCLEGPRARRGDGAAGGSAGFDTIVPTVDLATFGPRARRTARVRATPEDRARHDRRWDPPPELDLGLPDGWSHPLANVAASDGSGKRDGTGAINLAAYANEQLDPSLSWDDIEWFRSIWNGPIVVKGVQSVADARIAADLGIEAIAISNHGGRQLEGSPPPIELIAPVRDAIGDACEIICDGGIRRGADIVKALALGANATMGGRAHFFGLGAAGERGVELAFGFLHDEFRRAMALNGLRSVSEITPDMVSPPRNRTD